jgi:DNA transformation protein and related proteins
MPVGAAFLQYVLEQLERAGKVASRRMFGGVGLYCDGLFFGLIDDDTLYFKVDNTTRADYEARGGKRAAARRSGHTRTGPRSA